MAKIRMGIVGAGIWGETHAFLYEEHPHAELVAISDINFSKASDLAAKFGVSAYADHREMLKKEQLDAVAVVTPDFAHGDIAVDCANAGKHLLLEKPLATTREDVDRIVEAVQKNNVRIMVDLHNRWNPPFAVAKASVDSGELGEPYTAYMRHNDIKWVPLEMLSWADKSSILWFLGSHSTDTLRWFFGSEVERVYSVSRKGVLTSLGVDTDDCYHTILEFKNGGIATMENSWITPNGNPHVNDMKFNITCTKGMINLDLSNSQLIERFTEEGNDRPDVLISHFIHGKPKGFAYESIRHFVDCLVDGSEFLVSLEDAANTCCVILAIMESARTGKPVTVKY